MPIIIGMIGGCLAYALMDGSNWLIEVPILFICAVAGRTLGRKITAP